MRKQHFLRILSVLFFTSMLWWAGMGTVQGQFKQNKDTIKIDPSGFPADIQKGYRLFSMKCNGCHGLDTSLKPTMSASQWTAEVKRMQGMPSSQFNDAQAKAIVDFLNYYGAHRKPLNKQDDQSAASASGSAGSQFYDTQGCATCHAISGKGGTSGPSLSDVGKRLSKDQLTEKIQEIRTGKSSMPALPSETTDQQVKDLVDFLAGLGNAPQKKTEGNPKEPESRTENKPVDQTAASGSADGGRQFYDTQGCATCHAIGGKGGTAGPSLNDVGKRLSRAQLTEVIQKIRTGKSSMPPLPPGTTDQQVKDLTDFLVTLGGEQQKQSPDKPKESEPSKENERAAQAVPSGTGAGGRKFYNTQGCAKCHAIDGKGGTAGPSLNDVGKRLSRAQLTEVIQKIRIGKSSMPPLPAGTTDQQAKDLADFLVTLSSVKQNQGADKPKGSEIRAKNKSAAQAVPSGIGAGGRKIYDTQGCAKCHAIDGKGGTAGPSLSDVGKRLSKDQLTVLIQKMRTGKSSMPPLPPKTTDQQAKDLTDFLATLGSERQKQDAAKPNEAQTGTNQSSSRTDPPSVEKIVKMLAVPTNHGTMLLSGALLLLIAVTAILIGVLVFRPGLTATPDGKIMAFFGLFLLPLVCMGMGTTYHIDRSKSTTFCLSCHEMQPFGKSLLVDDPTHLPAAHFQNHRVPAGEACFACHTNYAMFGGFREKIQGLKEVYEHYLGNPPAPEAIRLSNPFNNRECLHCHLGARSFEEGAMHAANPYLLPAVKGNQVSCLSSGCHQTVHNVAELKNTKFWKGNP
jgi:mono/diheme cytochrome c family protein/nitrate/TMAO reductase-like tetraheme cytochrome c subunit